MIFARGRRVTALLACCLLAGSSQAPSFGSIDDAALKEKVKQSIDRGLKWLRTQQQSDGSWDHYPGITGLVLTAYTRSPRGYREDDGPFVRDSAKYLAGLAKPDGGLYDRDLPVYNTAVSLMALCSTGNAQYAPLIRKGRDFLVGQQSDEPEGYKPDDKFYGGIGYGNDERPDLSNLQFAIEGLRVSALDSKDPAWQRALTFLQRCQNRSESNDQAWAANDGGFVYAPGQSMAGETKSYGSMTYAGIKSFIHAHLQKDDPRVVAAVEWIRKHWTLKENPGMGAQGLFYYYHTMAKALRILGEPEFVDAAGVRHRWADELARELLSRQDAEGWWVNTGSDRWWEGNKVLVTAEAILALEEALAETGGPGEECEALTAAGPAPGDKGAASAPAKTEKERPR